MIDYLTISTIGLLTFYVVYLLLLQKERTFVFNRFYLLASVVFSLLLPFVEIPVSASFPINSVDPQLSLEAIMLPDDVEDGNLNMSAKANQSGTFSYADLLITAYFIGFSFMVSRFFLNLYRILRMTRLGDRIKEKNYTLTVCKKPIPPFTFFNQLFIHEKMLESGIDRDLIHHEEVHINHRHSVDILFMELLLVVFWFHPLLYLFRKKIELNHEYTADYLASGKASDLGNYLNKVLALQSQTSNIALVSSFSYLSIKNRIAMMTKNKAATSLKLKYSVVVLTSLFLLTAFSFKEQAETNPFLSNGHEKTIILDAGHGGDDPGVATGFNVEEKEVTLELVKQIKENLEKSTPHTVILTRSKDERVEVTDRVKLTKLADLFVSIHLTESSFPDTHLIVYSDLGEHWHESERLAQLTAYQFSRTSKEGRLAHQYSNYILNNAECPAVLIDLEYPTNSEDASYMNSSQGQSELAEKIARAIELAAY